MKWYLKVLKQYADFKGRARRKEYWMFVLFNSIFSLVAMMIDLFFLEVLRIRTYGLIQLTYLLIVLIPGIAVTVRRLHDIGKSGWMFFIPLIPIVGPVWMILLMATEGVPGENQYGKNPKEVIA